MRGKMIIICAPSGTGKSTLINRLKADLPDLEWSVSCTTRPMRTGEVDGKDYHFLAKEAFEQQIKDHQLIEWAQVHSNYYGTSKIFVDKGLMEGKKMLFDLDVQGADAMKKIYAHEAQVIFIEPPTIFELERRLKSRGTDEDKVITERMNNARDELKRKNDFDYLIMNDNVDEAYEKLKAAVQRILL